MGKELRAPKGATTSKKRGGRGPGSGLGQTAGRGTKGAGAREGYRRTPGFEGGQTSLFRRLPKFGFTNAPFKKEYDIVNVGELEILGAGAIDREALKAARLVNGREGLVKLLGKGEVTKAFTITVDAASKSAVEKIEKAGGSVTTTTNN